MVVVVVVVVVVTVVVVGASVDVTAPHVPCALYALPYLGKHKYNNRNSLIHMEVSKKKKGNSTNTGIV